MQNRIKKIISEEINKASNIIILEKKNYEINRHISLLEERADLLNEGFWSKAAAYIGIPLLSLTSALGQNAVQQINQLSFPQQIEYIQKAMENPEVKNELNKMGYADNNIQAAKDKLGDIGKDEYVKFAQQQVGEEDVQWYLENGWHLTDVQVEKLVDTIKVTQPDTIVSIQEVTINTDKSFGPGEFNIQSLPQIKAFVDSVKANNGVILGVHIESSTDKQRVSDETWNKLEQAGYTDSQNKNENLSIARNESVEDYLAALGISPTIIQQYVLFEQGAGETGAVTPQDPSARYVKVYFEVMSGDIQVKPGEVVTKTNNQKTYTFIKGAKGSTSGSKCFIKIKDFSPKKPHYNKCRF